MMIPVQADLVALFCESLKQSVARGGGTPRHENKDGLDDPRQRLTAALAEMLPSTLEEVALAAGLELPTAQAYLAEMSARSQVMFNPLTKRYSLPRYLGNGSFAA